MFLLNNQIRYTLKVTIRLNNRYWDVLPVNCMTRILTIRKSSYNFLIEKGTVGIMVFFLKLLKSCDLKLAWVLFCQSNKTRWQKFEEQISDSERNCVLKWGWLIDIKIIYSFGTCNHKNGRNNCMNIETYNRLFLNHSLKQ